MKRIAFIFLFFCLISGGYVSAAERNDAGTELQNESFALLQEWMDRLLDFQCENVHPALDGGLLCPACARMHGRIGDAVLPLMYLADRTGDEKYLSGAKRLMGWMENVHRPDGSWMNDVNVSDWNGTTVFAAIALYEALHYHGHLLDEATRRAWEEDLRNAGHFMMKNPFIYSRKREGMRNMNVNYSASATYALYAIGTYCQVPEFCEKAREIAADVKAYFTCPNAFLFGEGPNIWSATPHGCYPVDLLYNVEESLPNLAYYARMAGDEDMLNLVEKSMKTHLEFMLPDGAWDNSWGTRSFKWTYWGGRTSDGFMGGYYALAARNPEFAEAIARNLEVLKSATADGLLYGGMHYRATGMWPCIHHTFGHAKALASFLEQEAVELPEKVLPRDAAYGMRFFEEIRTWLLACGDWRGTLTGYDSEYKVKGTHPMGGVLSMLWNRKTGPVFASTMNTYRMIESPNMQLHNRKYLTNGSPRVEWMKEGKAYTNLDDLEAEITCVEKDGVYIFDVKCHLVDAEQHSPLETSVAVSLHYEFSDSEIVIEAAGLPAEASLILPVIASPQEKVVFSPQQMTVEKEKGRLSVLCQEGAMSLLPADADGRVINPVPGFAFVPVQVKNNEGHPQKVRVKIKAD